MFILGRVHTQIHDERVTSTAIDSDEVKPDPVVWLFSRNRIGPTRSYVDNNDN